MPAKAKSGRPKPQAKAGKAGKASKASKATSWRKVDVASDALRFSSMGGFLSLEELDGDADGSIRWDAAKVSAVPDVVPDDAADDAADDAPGSEPAPDDAPAPEPAADVEPAADAKPARKRKRKTKQPAEEPPAEERLPWAPPPKGQNKKRAATESDATATLGPTAVEPAEAVHEAEGEAAPVAEADMETDMSSWSQLGLHPELLARLAERGFARPTPIQEACLPPALHGRRDIVGAAETGSGKTLAFGLPILQRWLETRDKGEAREGLFGLIVTPTRELALQVAEHLRALMPLPDASCARVVTLVGGMAVVKQKRQLQERPDIIVATPGRLWELLSADPQPYLKTLDQLRFFVLDEVDRMVDAGHFKELDNILQLLQQKSNGGSGVEGEEADTAAGEAATAGGGEAAAAAAGGGGGGGGAKAVARPTSPRQIFLFSATLMLPPNAKEANAKKLKARAQADQQPHPNPNPNPDP